MQNKNKKKLYLPIKDHNNKSGNDKKTSQFYEQLEAILGDQPASTPPVVLDACVGGLSEDRDESDSLHTYTRTYVGFYGHRYGPELHVHVPKRRLVLSRCTRMQ